MATAVEEGQSSPNAPRWRNTIPEGLRSSPATAKRPHDADAPGSCDLRSSTEYIERGLSPKEASARLELQLELMRWSGFTVTVKGLKGAAAEANGVFALPKYVRGGVSSDGQPTGGALSTFCSSVPPETPTFTLESGAAFLYLAPGTPGRWVIAGSTDPENGPIWAEAPRSTESQIVPPDSRHWRMPASGEPDDGGSRSSIEVRVDAKRSMARLLFESGDSWLTPPEEMQDALDQNYELPRIAERLITVRGLSIVEAQRILLPRHPFDIAFASRRECFEKHGFPTKQQSGTYIGASPGVDLKSPENLGMPQVSFRAARWVELLDGTVHARLLTEQPVAIGLMRGPGMGGPPMPLDDENVLGPLLRGLRSALATCLSTPELAWALPPRHKNYLNSMKSLSAGAMGIDDEHVLCNYMMPYLTDQVVAPDRPFNELRSRATLGKVIRLLEKPLMAEIKLAELAANSDPDPNAKKSSFLRSLFGSDRQAKEAPVWVDCKVTKKDPVTLAIQVDRRPGHWLSLVHQGACLRVPSDAE